MAENAKRQLETGTWPQVMAVFGYETPRAPRKSVEEFNQLKGFFEKALYPNIVAFIDLLRLEEERMGVSMSFNVQLRRRSVPGEVLPTAGNVADFMSTPRYAFRHTLGP
jgi:hypothetical protein